MENINSSLSPPNQECHFRGKFDLLYTKGLATHIQRSCFKLVQTVDRVEEQTDTLKMPEILSLVPMAEKMSSACS